MNATHHLAMTVLLITPFAWAQEPGRLMAPQDKKGRVVNGLRFAVEMATELTTADSLEVSCRLENASDRQFTFATQPQTGQPSLILTPEGKPPITVRLHDKDGFWNRSGNYRPKPGEVAHAFTVDIRLFFGRLSAGAYSLEAVYPESAYALDGFPGFVPRDLVSPRVSFVVRDASLSDAQKSLPANPDVSFTTDEPSTPGGSGHVVRTGKLTNRTDRPIRFHAYTWGHKKGDPLSAIVTWEKWNPQLRWMAGGPWGWCGTGLGAYALEPGKSITVHLHNGQTDGIYRFALEYWTSSDDSTREMKKVYSNAVQVDDFARRHLPAEKPEDPRKKK